MTDSIRSPEDYPAAHSMDTMWFAVDKDGCVAAFESQEGGAVPESALSDQEMDVLGAFAEVTNECEVVYARDDHRYPLNQTYLHIRPHRKWRAPAKKPSLFNQLFTSLRKSPDTASAEGNVDTPEEFEIPLPLIMFFDNQECVESLLSQFNCQIVASTQGCAVIFRELPLEIHKDLHDLNLCRACVGIYSYSDDVPYRDSPSIIGLYFYSCCEGQMAYPYGRVTLPAKPLQLNDLPEDLQERLKQVRFADISFADTSYIQPAERVKSFSWDGGYLSENWKSYRAIPGQEDMYREVYETSKVNAEQDGIEYEPPSPD